ncbi:MAG: bacillithiol biosynthesis deacetylase BshB1 [Coriobacteriia bacterium]|nr:bacillithiol biosynthesis deacetylase BshB1 [Coriobacteriia bacterium]
MAAEPVFDRSGMAAEPVFDAVCVGAHPDDVEIGMGATIAKLTSAGKSVCIVDLTNGEPTPFGTPELRAQESAAAAKLLGVTDRYTLSQANRELFDTAEARTELAEALRQTRPRLLFVPYPEDTHPDHIAAARIALGARFYSKFTKTSMRGEPFYPPRVFHYMAIHMRAVVVPSFVVECAEGLSAKIDSVSAYESQFVANPANAGFIDRVRDTARYWGQMAGVDAGEPFFAPETVALRSFEDVL